MNARRSDYITVLAAAIARGAKADADGAYNGAELARVGFAMFGGCVSCGASVAAYNAHPTSCGYWRCSSCVEVARDGFATPAELEAWLAEGDEDEGEP